MYAARRSDQWCHTAAIMRTLANCHRDPKRPPYKLEEFLPVDLAQEFATERRKSMPRMTPAGLRMLKPLFERKSE